MDVGKFKASRGRLMAWIAIPPVLAAGIGMSAFAWQQRTEMELKQAQALSDILPSIIGARREAEDLFENLGLADDNMIGSENQLISFLQEAAVKHDFMVDSVQVDRRETNGKNKFPALNAAVEGVGEVRAVQFFINEVKSSQQLLSVEAINLSLPRRAQVENNFNVSIIFKLLLVDEVLKSGGAE